MRIRKIKDKDIYSAAELIRRSGHNLDADLLMRRLHDFQYKRNHTVVVASKQSKLISLMHIGIEPSLIKDRTAYIYSLFVDDEAKNMANNLLVFAKEWAKQHGCNVVRRFD